MELAERAPNEHDVMDRLFEHGLGRHEGVDGNDTLGTLALDVVERPTPT